MEKLNVAIADDNVRMADILGQMIEEDKDLTLVCLLYTSPSPRDA